MANEKMISRMKCPACGACDLIEVVNVPYTHPDIVNYLNSFYEPQGGVEQSFLQDSNYTLNECAGCGLIFQKYIPNDDLMLRLYEVWIDSETALKRHLNSTDYTYFLSLSRQVKSVIQYFGVNPARLELLDFGMGWGDWCYMAKAHGCNVSGTELSPARIARAMSHAIPIINWDEIGHRRFDFINTEQVFEHLPNPLETLDYLSKSLKPEGVLLFSVPNGIGIKHRLKSMDWNAPKGSRRSLNAVAPLEHINCFTKNTILKMADSVGLKQISFRPEFWSKNNLLDTTVRDVCRMAYRSVERVLTGQNFDSTRIYLKKKSD